MSTTTAAIERATVPLRPRTPAGCCDLAVMFYGRHVGPLLRLFLAIAGPAVMFVYAFGRFVGTDLSLALITAMLASKPLGLLSVAGTGRTAFGEPFELPARDGRERRTRTGRLAEVARSIVTAAAVIAAGALFAAVFDDAYGTGRLASLGDHAGVVILSVITAVLVLRSAVFVARRHAPGPGVRSGLLRGTLLRVALAAPLTLLFFEDTRAIGIGVMIFWVPLAGLIAAMRSFRGERSALADVDPGLHTRQADRALEFSEMAGAAAVVSAAVVVLSLVTLSAIEFAFTTAGLYGPLSGPIGDLLDPEFFELDLAFAAIGTSPLFAAASLAAVLFAYQIGRIAWFFAYLDARVRRDCWDMELLLAREAKRLEGE